ncbi:MAG: hypothetical protein HN701_15980 [Rhodospirillaceae bacterium]|nr:hypothetical protein [Rhodospirillaceae bacterium]
MKRIVKLIPEDMTQQSFEDFGYLWEVMATPKTHRILEPVKFQCDGKTTVSTIWQPNEGRTFCDMERHAGVTQGFVQLSGSKSIVCAATPTNKKDNVDIPDLQNIKAFFINPKIGFAFKRGTWHSLNRYIVDGDGASFLIFNSDPNPTEMVDYSSGKGTRYDDLGSGKKVEEFQHPGEFGIVFEIIVSSLP